MAVFTGSGSEDSPSITFSIDTDTGIFRPSADQVAVSTDGIEAARIDSSGRILVGTSTARQSRAGSTSFQTQLQLEADSSTAGIAISRFVDAPTPSYLSLQKGRGTGAAPTIVADSDTTGRITFSGWDGANFTTSAIIESEVDGTPGTDDMPGRLIFKTTADGSSLPEARMRIDSSGRVGIGVVTSPEIGLRILQDANGADLKVVSANWEATTGTITNLTNFSASRSTAGATITNLYGFAADNNLTSATNNYGFYSDLPSGTGRWNFYANGNAPNYFAGNVGINTTDPTGGGALPGGGIAVTIEGNLTTGSRCLALATDAGSGDLALQVVTRTNYATQKFVIYGDGSVENTTGSIGTLSDIRFKTNIAPASSQWADIKDIEIVNYDLQGEDRRLLGVVAQQVETVSPGLVVDRPKYNEQGEETDSIKGVRLSILYMKAVKALQEAMERIETLEAKVVTLEGA